MATYYLVSGEGTEPGTWQRVETDDIQSLLAQKRCGGKRWARAFTDNFVLADGDDVGYDVDSGELGLIPEDLIWSATSDKEKR